MVHRPGKIISFYEISKNRAMLPQCCEHLINLAQIKHLKDNAVLACGFVLV